MSAMSDCDFEEALTLLSSMMADCRQATGLLRFLSDGQPVMEARIQSFVHAAKALLHALHDAAGHYIDYLDDHIKDIEEQLEKMQRASKSALKETSAANMRAARADVESDKGKEKGKGKGKGRRRGPGECGPFCKKGKANPFGHDLSSE